MVAVFMSSVIWTTTVEWNVLVSVRPSRIPVTTTTVRSENWIEWHSSSLLGSRSMGSS
jgi:hypothetical protein